MRSTVRRMRTWFVRDSLKVRLVIGAGFTALGVGIGSLLGPPAQDLFDRDPFEQKNFPCQEDEVLGYGPQFGPDKVGCIHIDALH